MDACGSVLAVGPPLILSKAQKSAGANSPNAAKVFALDASVEGQFSGGSGYRRTAGYWKATRAPDGRPLLTSCMSRVSMVASCLLLEVQL